MSHAATNPAITPHERGRIVELTEDVSQSPHYSADMAPVSGLQRKWAMKDIAALWISMAACGKN